MSTAEEAQVLSIPSRELVEHATRELGWEERLVIYEMSASSGTGSLSVYNFPTLVNQLFGTRWDRLLDDGGKETLVWIDFGELIDWLRDVIGDAEFADAVAAAAEAADGFKDQIDAITPLFRERVGQYRSVLDAAESTQ